MKYADNKKQQRILRDWTNEDHERITAMWLRGSLSAAEIGRELGVSKNTIIGRLNKLGLMGKKGSNLSLWPEDDVKVLRKLVKWNRHQLSIAQALGLDVKMVLAKMRELNLTYPENRVK